MSTLNKVDGSCDVLLVEGEGGVFDSSVKTGNVYLEILVAKQYHWLQNDIVYPLTSLVTK